MARVNSKVIPFPSGTATHALPTAVNHPTIRLLKAAKAAERALTLALGIEGAGENVIVRGLRAAIADAECHSGPHSFVPAASHRSIPRVTDAAAAHLVRGVHSEKCFCGFGKQRKRPLCLRCYHALPQHLRAAMWLTPLDSDELFDRILQARAFLLRAGIVTEVIA